ncbi:carboxysome shell carbonic anhydrase [Ectothiorhodosinus mongolicus]|uniref:Carboxysome shell carbonic anhydrase n=1 Tax=Ectothiorhodosinus mongolicus TaxID=233100 RepID=A0A1R3VZU9_9GAMM|nr:carboxysome shell carbonic anhydrase [Ectothiorhodosinus mongolicus]ULX57941.1 carboxysome shell carbonic anhydrase [Ectothiorhodosinus mongolicus]SIT69627.1 carboxysome shell carbonic anhydrase [Ectothiorhodosinus mongolicus]
MNTRKRQAAMLRAGVVSAANVALPPNPACVAGPGQQCAHALVDRELNQRLYEYEQRVRERFTRILETLKVLSSMRHQSDFVAKAQQLASMQLGYALPDHLLEDAWIAGLDLRALHAYCTFQSFHACVENAESDQQALRERSLLDPDFIRGCGFHTVDISPCADGRLQGLVPFIFRMAPNSAVTVKAYAGALFDIESDIADWTHRELLRLSDGLAPGSAEGNYLKIAVYHFSTSNPGHQGCAAHGSNDHQATEAALDRLKELRSAIDNIYGFGAAPDCLLIGVDTDIDAIRVHLPDAQGHLNVHRFVDSSQLYRDTLNMDSATARQHIASTVDQTQHMDGWGRGEGEMVAGMREFVIHLLEANLSQIEYVIQHHEGRYQVIGHNERFICVGEAMTELQLRNKFYFAHLDTVEEGANDMDVGIRIFTGLNIQHGLGVPVLIHFHYSSRVPGARERAIQRCQRVKNALASRYAHLQNNHQLFCQMAISDVHGSERGCFVEDVESECTVH